MKKYGKKWIHNDYVEERRYNMFADSLTSKAETCMDSFEEMLNTLYRQTMPSTMERGSVIDHDQMEMYGKMYELFTALKDLEMKQAEIIDDMNAKINSIDHNLRTFKTMRSVED